MSETKKIVITGIIILAIISLIPITAVVTNIKSQKIIEDFHNYIDTEDTKLVYIGRDNCSYCQLFQPELDLISDEYDVDYLYINTNKLKDKHFSELLEELKADTEKFGTPYLAIVKDGKKIADRAGYLSEDALFEYLKEQNIIDKEEKLPLNYIDYEQYSKLIKSKTNQLIVIAQSGCNGCIKARPVLYELAQEYGLTINYLNASMLDEESATSFQESLDFFSDGISTPLMLVVSNSEVVDAIAGAVEMNDYVEFLKENNFIK